MYNTVIGISDAEEENLCGIITARNVSSRRIRTDPGVDVLNVVLPKIHRKLIAGRSTFSIILWPVAFIFLNALVSPSIIILRMCPNILQCLSGVWERSRQ